MQRTILLVTQAFPPEPVVGAIRVGNVARAFARAGHRVLVVTPAMKGESPGRRESMPGVEVHTFAQGRRYRERLTGLLNRFQRNGAPGPPASTDTASGATTSSPGSPRGLRALLLSLVWVPDDELRLVWPAYRTARRLRERIDLVYTSAPAHSANVVGLLFKRLHGIPWCAEFRDPWCYPHGHHITPLVTRVNRWLERQCLQAMDTLVTVTEGAADLYRDRLGGASHKVVNVRNGIPAVFARTSPAPDAPFRIVYSGNIYGGRDPRAFLEAVAEVAGQPETPALAVDLFVSAHEAADAHVARLGIGHIVTFHDWVSHEEIQRVMRSADLLLVLAQRQPLQVPNKLYEYLGTGVPILAVADEDGETAHMLRQAGGHFVVAEDRAAPIAAAIRQAIDARGAAPASNAAVLHDWMTDRQMDRLVGAVRP